MKELRARVAKKCWQTFDGHLSQHKWLINTHNYNVHRAHVQSDALESLLTRYQTLNEQRLASHFKTTFQQCVSAFNTKRGNLPMPATEEDVDFEYNRLATSLHEMLEAESR